MKIRFNLTDIVPIAVFALIIIIFGVGSGGTLLSSYNLLNIFSQTLATVVAGLGMMFVIAMGGTDITHGSLVGVAAAVSMMAALSLGNFFILPVAALVGIASGLLMGFLNAKLKVSSFMASLSLLIAMRAICNIVLGTQGLMVPTEVANVVGNPAFELISLIVIIGIFVYLVNYTRLGFYVKAIGENENAVKYAGINVDKIKIIAFVISGLMAAIASIFTVVNVGGASNTTGASFEMQVMMALFIGGIPVNGGMGTKIYKIVIGALMITTLESGLVLCGVSGTLTEGIRGLLLLGAVFFTQAVSRTISKKRIHA